MYRSSAVFDYGVAQVTSSTAGSGGIDSSVVIRRYGDGIFPISVRVTFGDGSTVLEPWDGRDPWHAFTYRKPVGVTTVEVDPDRVLLLDVNVTNNSWTSQPKAEAAARKWSVRWLTWVEELLLSYAYFT
jgi:hypothetical protein